MTSIELTYQKEASLFLEKLFFELNSLAIDYSKWDIDHLCFRTETLEHYEQIKKDFSIFSTLLIESPVNGRPIATYKLKSPWIFGENFIDLIEVPAPKPNKMIKPGFEHIEVVMADNFENIQKRYPMLNFEENAHHKAFNPELVANLKNGDIKFHHQSLEIIINIEKLDNVLANLQKNFSFPKLPFFICGTLPLGFNNPHADIDIAVEYQPSDKVKILEWVQNFQDKTISPKLKIHNDIMVFNFEFDQRKYEFYFSHENIFQQNAYRHLNIEMRLLKIFGSSLHKKVVELKSKSLKTEHAFLEALNIKSNAQAAFLDIYQLEKLTDKEIYARN